ncbi:MAG: hypothetical protein EU532_01665 [Promethearchaeota archaeon]|nr:MAG: hypothetical protein EU532_01665 [Candidatus Lokiarchaeota archaeon]
MTIFKSTDEIFFIFDSIKSKLNDLIIYGAESYNTPNISEIMDLKEKLKTLNLTLIVESLEEFLDSMEKNEKSKIAKNVLKIISITRMFESIMNIELIKKELFYWIELTNAKSKDQ